ncbi:unnamed protein product [Phytomonas sp. EM1]|nr:unnamed protein product [Phytomonas sp. EM1]|eukprot:CCW61937.1 unnamed protein product [Phytomonas sp. isolate EM1]
MTYSKYCANRDEVTIRVRSWRGETIDLSVPKTCTVGELLDFLTNEYRYSDKTCLMYNNVPVNVNDYVSDYPYDSLMIAEPKHNSVPQTQGYRTQQAQSFVPSNGHDHSKVHGRGQYHQQSPPQRVEPQPLPAKQPEEKLEKVPNQAKSPFHVAPTHSRRQVNTYPKLNTSDCDRKQTPPTSRANSRALFSPDGESSRAPVGLSSLAPKSSISKKASGEPESGVAQYPTKLPRKNENFSERASSAHGSTHAKAFVCSTAKDSPGSLCGAEITSASGVDNSGVLGPSEGRPTPRQPARLMIHCCVPAQRRTVNVELSSDASMADLMLSIVAEVPEAVTGKLVFRGKVLPQTPESSLFNVGIRGECMVFVASGEYSNLDLIFLEEIEMDVDRIEKDIENSTTDLQKKGYYEELMRILFRVDGLQNLEEQWKQKRKDMVKRITYLQDKLNVDSKGSVVGANTNIECGTSAFSYAEGAKTS